MTKKEPALTKQAYCMSVETGTLLHVVILDDCILCTVYSYNGIGNIVLDDQVTDWTSNCHKVQSGHFDTTGFSEAEVLIQLEQVINKFRLVTTGCIDPAKGKPIYSNVSRIVGDVEFDLTFTEDISPWTDMAIQTEAIMVPRLISHPITAGSIQYAIFNNIMECVCDHFHAYWQLSQAVVPSVPKVKVAPVPWDSNTSSLDVAKTITSLCTTDMLFALHTRLVVDPHELSHCIDVRACLNLFGRGISRPCENNINDQYLAVIAGLVVNLRALDAFDWFTTQVQIILDESGKK